MDSELYLRGIKLFNSAAFFEAHEVLEDVWRAAPEPERKFLQGVIQVAVALYHHGNGNLVGARSLLDRASKNLSAYPESFGGIELTRLRHSIAQWQRALAEGTPVPPWPKLAVVGRPPAKVLYRGGR
ncbi:MAG: hypothetical protein AUH86_24750 [Acidobacteria bacterium 13_1_40CM_4_58_4]|nr:MAG: hypothetical protein AUH86_24750 [Acidobacteria bacterium 13_1_40CM_4_58_4]